MLHINVTQFSILDLSLWRHQLSHGQCYRSRFPGPVLRGAGETEGGVEVGAGQDGGGDPDPETGSGQQGKTCTR